MFPGSSALAMCVSSGRISESWPFTQTHAPTTLPLRVWLLLYLLVTQQRPVNHPKQYLFLNRYSSQPSAFFSLWFFASHLATSKLIYLPSLFVIVISPSCSQPPFVLPNWECFLYFCPDSSFLLSVESSSLEISFTAFPYHLERRNFL